MTAEKTSLVKRLVNFLFRPSITKKILFGYLALAALIIIISVVALSALKRLNEMNEGIIRRDLPLIEATDKMIDSLLAQELYARRYGILRSSDILALFWERSREFDLMAEKIANLPGTQDVPVDRLISLHTEYNNLFMNSFSSAVSQGSTGRTTQKQEELIRLLKEVSAGTRKAQGDKMRMNAYIGTVALRGAGVLCGVGILLSITAGMLIARTISKSINHLKHATEEISEGRFEYQSNIPKQDELGELSLAFSEMSRRLKSLEEMCLDASPLTRLPGGVAIENVLKRRLDSNAPLAFCLLDMDNFKAFNDHYGYARSSEVIKAVARIMEATVGELGMDEDFIGHIGGDDFVVITSPERYPEICNTIIRRFDKTIVDFYDPHDLERGHIIGRNRQGQNMSFPVMTLSIAVVTNLRYSLINPVQVGEIAAQLKEYAKSLPGSIYVVDKHRKDDLQSEQDGTVLTFPE
ncbi:MAG: diguanylate cyclase [Thermodesulfovibrionales bacterium]|jgi:GGDEF domain-containing protein/CHASE3 domain sensor protein